MNALAAARAKPRTHLQVYKEKLLFQGYLLYIYIFIKLSLILYPFHISICLSHCLCVCLCVCVFVQCLNIDQTVVITCIQKGIRLAGGKDYYCQTNIARCMMSYSRKGSSIAMRVTYRAFQKMWFFSSIHFNPIAPFEAKFST